MSILGRLLALLLITLLASTPGLASISGKSQPACDMVGMHDDMGSAGAITKALSGICKMQCQTTAMPPQANELKREAVPAGVFVQLSNTALPSHANPPEAPPPRS